jgi:hypothetical protein
MADISRYRLFKDTQADAYMSGRSLTGALQQFGPYNVLNVHDSLSDVKVEKYKERLAAGEIFNNPCHRITVNNEEIQGVYNYQTTGTPIKSSSNEGAVWSFTRAGKTPTVDIEPILLDYKKIQKQASLKALEKIDVPDFAFGEDLAEAHKSLKSIRGIGEGFVRTATIFRQQALADATRKTVSMTQRMVGSVKHLDKHAASKVLFDAYVKGNSGARNAWLKARYEYRPLSISLDNALSVYYGALDAMASKVRGTAHATYEDRVAQTVNYSMPGYHVFHYTMTREHTYRVKAYVLYTSSIENSKFRELGLSVKDVIPTCWAVVPYSFLVDRFVDITQLIKAAQNAFDPRIKVLASGIATTYVMNTEDFLTGATPGSGFLITEVSGGKRESYVSNVRKPMPIVDLLSFPVVNLQQDWETAVDVYSIFTRKLKAPALLFAGLADGI